MMRKTPLTNRQALGRHVRLQPQSSKRRRQQRQRRRAGIAAYGPEPLCAVRWDERCTVYADALHEVRKASQGGSRTDMSNCVPCCSPCNSVIEDEPLEAHRRGWVRRAEDVL